MCFGDNKSSTGTGSLGTTNTTTSNTFDPWVTAGSQGIFSGAQSQVANNPYQGYNGPTQAAFGAGTGAASSYLQSVLGQNNPLTTQAAGDVSSVAGAINPNASVSDYMSPYTDAALQPTIRKILETSGTQSQANNAAASMAGAYGGSASGVTQALLNRDTQQNIGDATAAAYDKAFTNAQGARISNLQTLLSAGQGLSGIGQAQSGQQNTIAQLLAGIGQQQQSAGQTGIQTAIGVNNSNQAGSLAQYSTLASILGALPRNSTSNSVGTTTNNGSSVTSTPNNSGWALGGTLLSSLLA